MNKRIIIKIGTNVLTADSQKLSKEIIKQIVGQISTLMKKGYQVVLITSGAMGAGKEIIEPKIKNKTTKKAVLASIGQAHLMKIYNEEFGKYNIKTGQLLLTKEDFSIRSHYLNLTQTLNGLLDNNILPIINENDSVATYELTFGDNDRLAANTAIALDAEKLLILTNLDGLYSADPNKNKNAKLISEVKNIDQNIENYCSKQKSTGGLGGMRTKLNAVKLATRSGITSYIINGLKENNILDVLDNKKIGTKFLASNKNIKNKNRWHLSSTAMAKIMIDDGAKKALKNRTSLLLVGVQKIEGEFDKKEIVEIIDLERQAVGYGVIDFSSNFLKNKKKIDKEIIHADNITLL